MLLLQDKGEVTIMKKLCLLLSLICAISIFSSCSPIDVPDIEYSEEELKAMELEAIKNQDDLFDEYYSNEGKVDEIISRANNEPYQQLITRTYPEKEFIDKNFIRPLIGFESWMGSSIATVDRNYPAECIRRVDDDWAYTIHKTNKGGLLYRFYTDKEEEYRTMRWRFSHSVYVRKKLKHSRFKSIKPGDSWRKVNRIDPIVNIHLNKLVDTVSVHLLQDGVLLIEYVYDQYNKKHHSRVVYVDFFPDFIATVRDGPTFDCRILPQDFIA